MFQAQRLGKQSASLRQFLRRHGSRVSPCDKSLHSPALHHWSPHLLHTTSVRNVPTRRTTSLTFRMQLLCCFIPRFPREGLVSAVWPDSKLQALSPHRHLLAPASITRIAAAPRGRGGGGAEPARSASGKHTSKLLAQFAGVKAVDDIEGHKASPGECGGLGGAGRSPAASGSSRPGLCAASQGRIPS